MATLVIPSSWAVRKIRIAISCDSTSEFRVALIDQIAYTTIRDEDLLERGGATTLSTEGVDAGGEGAIWERGDERGQRRRRARS